jgi:hypothetical protein
MKGSQFIEKLFLLHVADFSFGYQSTRIMIKYTATVAADSGKLSCCCLGLMK